MRTRLSALPARCSIFSLGRIRLVWREFSMYRENDTIGPYILRRKLGKGAFGVV